MSRLQQWKRVLWQWRGVGIAAPSATAIVLLLRFSGLLQGLEWGTLDRLARSQPLVQDDRIVVVEFRESDQKYGHPLSDKTLALLLNKIKQQQPRAIGLDFYRDRPVGEGYGALAQVFRTTPNLVGIQKIGGSVDLAAVPPSPELAKLGQVAANGVLLDGDSKLRRGLLFVADNEGNNLPTLGMAMALLYLQPNGIAPEMADAHTLKLGQTRLPLFHGNDGGYVRADDQGYQLLGNSIVRPSSFQRLSVAQVLEGKVSGDWGRDRIVLIGPTAESLNDFFFTPASYQGLFKSELRIPGVYIHAQLTSQLLGATLDRKPFLQVLPDLGESLWIGAWALIGALLVWKTRSGQVWISGLSLGAGAAVCGIAVYVGYLSHLWLPLVPALMGFGGSVTLVMAYQAYTTTEMRKTLGRYLTNDVVASLLENPQGLTLKGETRKVTTLISDIRGFTSLSEQYPAERIVQMLNLYLAVMTQVIQRYGGTINDLTGDGILVFFGAPLSRPNDTAEAVACALAMQLAMETVNAQNQTLGFPQLEMGIGLNTGEVVVGNIGSDRYLKYTAIGAHVNLAARVESFTVGGQVLITENTLADVRSIVQVAGQTEAQMKGVAKPVALYEVSGMGGDYNLMLRSETAEPLVVLKQPIPLSYGLLEGKHLGDEVFSGELVALSAKGAEIRGSHCPAALTNLKLELRSPSRATDPEESQQILTASAIAEIYGKVIRKVGQAEGSFWICFTMVPPQVAEQLQQLRGDRRARI
jgi:adenylate cyclase